MNEISVNGTVIRKDDYPDQIELPEIMYYKKSIENLKDSKKVKKYDEYKSKSSNSIKNE